jgi:hypothetical protein
MKATSFPPSLFSLPHNLASHSTGSEVGATRTEALKNAKDQIYSQLVGRVLSKVTLKCKRYCTGMLIIQLRTSWSKCHLKIKLD